MRPWILLTPACKRWTFFLILIALCISAARFCHHQTKGFRLTKVQSNLFDTHVQELSIEEIQYIRSLFAQPFRYLGRGHQSFVFISDDQEHVIKVFNNAHQRKIAFFKVLSYIPFFNGWASQKMSSTQTKCQKTFESYAIAFEEMRDQTGLLFSHLNATEGLPPITLIDPLNIRHRLNSNTLGFLIQKKVKLVYPALEEWIQHEDIDKAKRALSNLLDLFMWKCQKGIFDNDPLIRTNFGFLDEDAVQIDVGPLSKDLTIQESDRMRAEILRITTSLKQWLEEKSPDLLVYLDQQLQVRLSL